MRASAPASRGHFTRDTDPAAVDDTDAATYALADGLGSVRGRTDGAGAVVGTADYDAFGVVRSSSGAGGAFGFAGEQSEAATGQLYLRARSYAPGLGRFLSVDPEFPSGEGTQGYQPYAYAGNNPATRTDPSGRNPIDCTWVRQTPWPYDDVLCPAVKIAVGVGITIGATIGIIEATDHGPGPGPNNCPPGTSWTDIAEFVWEDLAAPSADPATMLAKLSSLFLAALPGCLPDGSPPKVTMPELPLRCRGLQYRKGLICLTQERLGNPNWQPPKGYDAHHILAKREELQNEFNDIFRKALMEGEVDELLSVDDPRLMMWWPKHGSDIDEVLPHRGNWRVWDAEWDLWLEQRMGIGSWAEVPSLKDTMIKAQDLIKAYYPSWF